MLQNIWVLLIGIALAVFYSFFPDKFEMPIYYILILGLIFPGIPHGALDNYLLKKPLNSFYEKTTFYSLYIGLMALILFTWLLSPLLGLIVFLICSSWHFGQTDNLAFGIKKPFLHLLNGSLVLSFILLSHSAETYAYLALLNIGLPPLNQLFAKLLSIVILLSLVLVLIMYKKTQRHDIFIYIGILIVSSMLPLIAGFGLYFIGVHSINGWQAIQKGLKLSHFQLLKKASLFSLLAYLFIASFLWFYEGNLILNNQTIALFFIALSCISIPHIVLMHYFYGHK